MKKPKREGFVGETVRATCGLKAKITYFRRNKDFWVQFSDGAITHCDDHERFLLGNVRHPNDTSEMHARLRLGEERQQHCGLIGRISRYNKSNDIDVYFPTVNQTLTNVVYSEFCRGKLRPPSVCGLQTSFNELYCAYALKKFGFKKYSQAYYRKMGLGQREFDLFNEKLKVAVEYDGVAYHQDVKRDFEKDKIAAELGISLYRLREPQCPVYDTSPYVKFYNLESKDWGNCSLQVALQDIAKTICGDSVSVDFSKAQKLATEQYHNAQTEFQHRVGETVINNHGHKNTLVAWHSSKNIDLCVEGYPNVIIGADYHSLFTLKGEPKEVTRYFALEQARQWFLTSKNRKIRLVEHRGFEDCDFQVEGYPEIIRGHNFDNVFYKRREPKEVTLFFERLEHIGESTISKQGRKITIVGWNGAQDVDVKIDGDDTVYKHVLYRSIFVLKNEPLAAAKKRNNKIGETAYDKAGRLMTIVGWRHTSDIDIMVQGCPIIAKHVRYAQCFQEHSTPRVVLNYFKNKGV